MENFCLENLWATCLSQQGWSEAAIQWFIMNCMPATWNTYNRQALMFMEFCCQAGLKATSATMAIVTDFMCSLAKLSTCPKAILNTTSAALSQLYRALGVPSPVNEDIYKLLTGIIKVQTTQPMMWSEVMPRKTFITMFKEWGENERLSTADLQLKAVTLLALTIMLRPSDIAPRSIHISHQGKVHDNVFTCDKVFFTDQGMVLYLHGIKNDYSRDGFCVCVNLASDPAICPVRTLEDYLESTSGAGHKGTVFVSLKDVNKPVTVTVISGILNKAMKLAGLDSKVYSAKSFRPTTATAAVEAGLKPDQARAIGRWQCQETFEHHYVHALPDKAFTDKVLAS